MKITAVEKKYAPYAWWASIFAGDHYMVDGKPSAEIWGKNAAGTHVEKIAVIHNVLHGRDNIESHARLIAAAPELLSALKTFLATMDKFGEWEDGCFYYDGVAASELQDPIWLAERAIRYAEGR